MAPLEPQKKVLVAMEFLDSDHSEIPCETCHGGNADASDKSVALTRTNTRPSRWASSATAVNATPAVAAVMSAGLRPWTRDLSMATYSRHDQICSINALPATAAGLAMNTWAKGAKVTFKSIVAVFALFNIFIAGDLAAVAEETEVTMDAIYVPVGRLVLAPPVGVTPKRSAVAFPHSRHFGYTCKTCHHKWDGNSQVQSCTASKCHDQPSSPVKHKKALDYEPEAIRYYKYAFHHNVSAATER